MTIEGGGRGFGRFVTAYLAYIFLFDFVLAYAIYAAFFSFMGLGYAEIGALLAIWSASALAFELLTGALSDWLDRRLLLIAAPLIKMLTFVVWVLAGGSFWLYALGFVFWSFAGALVSGTGEALLFERAEAAGRKDAYDRFFGQARAATSIGVGAGLLLGGLVAEWNMEATFWLSLPPMLIAAIAAFWLVDVRRNPERAAERAPGFLETFVLALRDLRKAPQARFLIGYIAIGLVLFAELEEFDQLYFVAVDLPIWMFGIAGVAALALNGIVSMFAHRLTRFSFLSWATIGIGGALMILATVHASAWSVIVLVAAYLVAVPATVLAEARFQTVIAGQARATVTSALYFLQNATALGVALVFGALAESVGILDAYRGAGIVLLGLSAWYAWRAVRGKRAF